MGGFLLQTLVLLGALGLISLAVNLLGGALHNLTGFHIAEGLRANLKSMTSAKAYKSGFYSTITSLGTLKSYTTILGYTNSRLLTQTRAVAVMRGAMAGELMIVWFVALMITIPVLNQVSLPICGLGYLSMLLFPKIGELKLSARMFLSVGLLLIGITLAKTAMRDLTFSFLYEASKVIVYTSAGGFSIFIGVLIGSLIAAAMRSSTMAVIVALLLGVTIVGNYFAVGLAIGAPLGLMFPLAKIAISTSASSRRVIVLHSLTLFVAAALAAVAASFLTENLLEQHETNLWIIWTYSVYALVFVPIGWIITRPVSKLVNIIIPNIPEPKKLRLLSNTYKPDAALMMLEVDEELLRHNRRSYKMISFLRDLLVEDSQERKEELYSRIGKYKKISENVHHEIVSYLCNINPENNPYVSRRMARNIDRMAVIENMVGGIWQIGVILERVETSEHKLSPVQAGLLSGVILEVQKLHYAAISEIEAGKTGQKESEPKESLLNKINQDIDNAKRSYYPYNQSPMIEMLMQLKIITTSIANL